MALSYYFAFVSVAWAIVTAALPIVFNWVSFSISYPPTNLGVSLVLGSSVWLLLTRESLRGLGRHRAFLMATAALFVPVLWLMYVWFSLPSSAPWAVGLLLALYVTVFVPTSILLIALGLRWTRLLPLVPFILAVPLVVDLLSAGPWWLLLAVVLLFWLNAVLGRTSGSERDQVLRASRLVAFAYAPFVYKPLTVSGVILTMLLVLAFELGITYARPLSGILFFVEVLGPLAFMIGVGLWTLKNDEG